jgi:hypothetical protein
MGTSQPSIKPAVARRSAEAQLREHIVKLEPAHRRLVGVARR